MLNFDSHYELFFFAVFLLWALVSSSWFQWSRGSFSFLHFIRMVSATERLRVIRSKSQISINNQIVCYLRLLRFSKDSWVDWENPIKPLTRKLCREDEAAKQRSVLLSINAIKRVSMKFHPFIPTKRRFNLIIKFPKFQRTSPSKNVSPI